MPQKFRVSVLQSSAYRFAKQPQTVVKQSILSATMGMVSIGESAVEQPMNVPDTTVSCRVLDLAESINDQTMDGKVRGKHFSLQSDEAIAIDELLIGRARFVDSDVFHEDLVFFRLC